MLIKHLLVSDHSEWEIHQTVIICRDFSVFVKNLGIRSVSVCNMLMSSYDFTCGNYR